MARRIERSNPAAKPFIKEKREMGFLFYATFVRFVLRGEFAIVLMEHARAFVRAAGR